MPPRLVVGAIFGETPLAVKLEHAGHAVITIDVNEDPGAITHVDLVLIDGEGDAVRWGVEKLHAYARPRQMFLHTALDAGTQLLDDVETTHAIVMCAHNLFGEVWVSSAADELGETVVGLLIAEIGGVNLPINDADRPAIAAAQRLRALENVVRFDAYDLLRATVPGVEVFSDELLSAPPSALQSVNTVELDRIAEGISDRGVLRLFVDLQRRQGEQTLSTDVELWAFEKYGGRL